MPHILDGFDWQQQDRLYALKCDIRIGERNEGFYPPEVNYYYWATCTEGRYKGEPYMIDLMVNLGQQDVMLYCEESNDSYGDWLVVHGLWDGDEAA